MLAPALALLLITATSVRPAPQAVVDGPVLDAVGATTPQGATIWLSIGASGKKPRRLLSMSMDSLGLRPGPAVPPGAVFFDACGGRLVFSDPHGLVDDKGTRLLAGQALFPVADQEALWADRLCDAGGDELRAMVIDGIAIRRGSEPVRVLAFSHQARAYSGRVHRGLRAERPYATALSLYGPRLIDADVDGDRLLDLVAVHEGRIGVFLRKVDGLQVEGLERNLFALIKAGKDADLRVRIADIDGDARADAVVAVSEGAVPESSEAWTLTSASAPLGHVESLWKKPGLVTPLGVQGGVLVEARVDTSLVSLSSVVLTGKVPVTITAGTSTLALEAKADVRAGRMDGALPLVAVDFNRDGVLDLVDLGAPGRAALHLGKRGGGFVDSPAEVWSVPRFVHVVPLPAQRAVVLVGAPQHGRTVVALLRTGPA